MEIKEKEYIRYIPTNDWVVVIKKVTKIECRMLDNAYYLDDSKEEVYSSHFDDITKHSKDIIDLLECNDIIVIEYYVSTYKKRITRKFVVNKCINNYITFENVHCNWSMTFENNRWNWNESKGFNPKIISVLTKEQYIQNAYTIEKER